MQTVRMADYRLTPRGGMSAEQCRAARAWLGWTQGALAYVAEVGISTVKDFENNLRKTLPAIIAQLQATLEAAGVNFYENENVGIGITVEPSGYFDVMLLERDPAHEMHGEDKQNPPSLKISHRTNKYYRNK